jgi:hypothetical protein
MDLDAVFAEVGRVLAPGGVFLFSEEPVRRLLSLRLYRCPYWESMKPWERRLFRWGLLGYLVQDVIGAHQEESFGIRQNHRMYLNDWNDLVARYFVAREYDLFVPERGWGERWMKRLAVRLDPYRSTWRAARLLGGTLAAVCRKAGDPTQAAPMDAFESLLRCPDCHGDLHRRDNDVLQCARCQYEAPNQGMVYNLLPSAERTELYPGDRDDVLDISLPGHERRLLDGWHAVEGTFGNKYRWISGRAAATLRRVTSGPLRLRIRGYAPEAIFTHGQPVVQAQVNGQRAGNWSLDRVGLFVLEADIPEAAEYHVELTAAPEWRPPGDQRLLTVNISMVRLVPAEP